MLERLLFSSAAFFLALAVAAAASTLGALAIRSRSRIAESFLIGYPIFGTLCFLIALITTNRWALTALTVLLLIAAAVALRPSFSRIEIAWIPAALLFVCVGLAKLVALLPAISLDELAYHLAVPKIWISEGRAIDLPLLSHSYFPFGIESASLPLLSILASPGAIAAHFLNMLAAAATATAIFSYVHRRVSARAAWYATLAVAATPALLATAGFAWNDWPLAGLAVVLLRALDEDDERTAAAAIAAGLLTKYTFLPLAAVLLIVRGRAPGWRIALGAGAGSVFFLRNLILTGNPFAPFLESDAPAVAGFRAANIASYIFDPRFVDEALGLSLLIALSGVVLATRGFARVAGLAATLAGAILLLMGPSSRIVIPYLLIGVLAGSAALERKPFRIAIGAAALLQIAMTALYVAALDPLPVAKGRITDAEYLRTHRRSFADIEQVNAALPADSRALVVGLNELYWFSMKVRGGGNFDGPRVNGYLEQERLAEALRADGITHVLLFAPTAISVDPRKTEERATNLSPRALQNLRSLEGDRSAITPSVISISLRP